MPLDAPLAAGQPYGIRKLGWLPYMCDHTENSFPQDGFHFPCARIDNPEMLAWMPSNEFNDVFNYSNVPPAGSLSEDLADYLRNPFELGWGKQVKFDHDFVGREELERIAADHKTRRMVTLVWNPEDICDIYRSYFDKENESYKFMEFPQNYQENFLGQLEDRVIDADGNVISVSMGRLYTIYYKDVISQCVIDPEFAELGTEVAVVWGEPGTRQKVVRATVARYPYLDLAPNKDYDVDSIPRLNA